MSEEKTMENINFTKEEWDAILDCVSTKYMDIMKERVEALPNLQKDLNSSTEEGVIKVAIKDNDSIAVIQKYLERQADLEVQNRLFSGLYEKLTTIYDKNHEGERKK